MKIKELINVLEKQANKELDVVICDEIKGSISELKEVEVKKAPSNFVRNDSGDFVLKEDPKQYLYLR